MTFKEKKEEKVVTMTQTVPFCDICNDECDRHKHYEVVDTSDYQHTRQHFCSTECLMQYCENKIQEPNEEDTND